MYEGYLSYIYPFIKGKGKEERSLPLGTFSQRVPHRQCINEGSLTRPVSRNTGNTFSGKRKEKLSRRMNLEGENGN